MKKLFEHVGENQFKLSEKSTDGSDWKNVIDFVKKLENLIKSKKKTVFINGKKIYGIEFTFDEPGFDPHIGIWVKHYGEPGLDSLYPNDPTFEELKQQISIK